MTGAVRQSAQVLEDVPLAWKEPTMLGRDIMSTPPVTAHPTDSVTRVAGILSSRGFTALPVVDDDDRLIGIVTEADLLDGRIKPDDRRVRPERRAHRARGGTVGDVMTSPVESLTPAADVADAAQMMVDERIRCLPIVDGHRIVGVITRRDLLRTIT